MNDFNQNKNIQSLVAKGNHVSKGLATQDLHCQDIIF